MRRILRFAGREYLAAVRTKGFIIGLVIAPLMMSGSLIAFFLLKDNVDTADKTVALVDRTGRVAAAIVDMATARNTRELYEEGTGKKVRPAYLFEVVTPNTEDPSAQRLDLSEKVRRGDLHAFLEIGENVIHPDTSGESRRIFYYAKNAAMDDLRRWLVFPINDHLRVLRLADAGISQERVGDLFSWISVDGMGLVSLDKQTGDVKEAERASEIEAILVPIATMMLMFLMIMMSVPGMVHSVMEEKTQRIAEVLLGSIKPFEFMAGKLVGGIGVSLTSSLVYIIGAVGLLNYMGFDTYIPYRALGWFFAYMLTAIIMFGAMAAALGATCSEPKDAQSLSFPVILPAILPMFVYFPVAKEPAGALATWLSLVPPFTPTLMVLRLATPDAIPPWQPVVGLVGVLLFTFLSVWAGARIFRVAILMQGTPPRLSNIVRWAFRG